VLDVATVSHIMDSNADPANVPSVPVHIAATNSAEDPMLDKVSGTRTPPAVRPGRVWAPRGKGAGQ
jgi:hypothetical protein